ncbi:hypothetical protein JOF46_001404 [Paeniglutamicibacter psychrophenolicus]|uniref:Tn3 transposase DDE domain-containing protein n=1 Tax=Paeniglutamicibacter psychrophenolicus TaxID=257454 RepID=A0ABS4WBB3_9MICC|nr:hypothetical protein [Paeniglutamicibacter psychrophenolicus]
MKKTDGWTGFTLHFTNLKSGQPSKDNQLLLTAILADGINLGLTKMSESCTGVIYAPLDRQQASHIRDETYSAALVELVNTQHAHPFGAHWGTAPHLPRTGSASVPEAMPIPPGM